jgi:hypothetical protein
MPEKPLFFVSLAGIVPLTAAPERGIFPQFFVRQPSMLCQLGKTLRELSGMLNRHEAMLNQRPAKQPVFSGRLPSTQIAMLNRFNMMLNLTAPQKLAGKFSEVSRKNQWEILRLSLRKRRTTAQRRITIAARCA